MKCPRRVEVPWAETRYPNDDEWQDRNGYPCCSFCGSLDPVVLLDLIKSDGCTVGATDKNYKMYVNVPGHHLKFYFMHFSEPQMDEFIALINARKLKFDYGSGFYVLPYFVIRKEVGSDNE